MDIPIIIKYKNINIDNINIYEFDIQYNNNNFYIQCPIFTDYEIINSNNNKYLEIKLKYNKISHNQFLSFIEAIEFKMKKINKNITSQIITDIQNNKVIKIKFNDNTNIYNKDKIQVDNLTSSKISLLLNIQFYKLYYTINAIQILQLS
tara:strand:- start:6499 stop:6945 length:447 start_codon:yes stop_codon:yes gene_type:complete